MVNTNSVLSSILFSQTIDWNIKQFFSSTSINSSFELKRIGKAITRRKDQMVVEDDKRYKRITIKTNCGGVFVRDEVLGKDIKTKKQYYVKAGQLAVSKIDARNGAFGIVPPEADGAIITGNFWVYDVNPEIANIDYLILLLSSNVFVQAWQDCSNGSGNRLYLQEDRFLNYKIIGNNGSGKSNVLEAISGIFVNAYSAKAIHKFVYSLTYEIKGKEVKLEQTIYRCQYYVDGKVIAVKELALRGLLPTNVIALYSGEDKRWWHNYYEPFYLKFTRDINAGTSNTLSPKMYYINKYYWDIALLSLVYSTAEDDKQFLRETIGRDTVDTEAL